MSLYFQALPGQTVAFLLDLNDPMVEVTYSPGSWQVQPSLKVYAAGIDVTASFSGAAVGSPIADDAGNAASRVLVTIPIPASQNPGPLQIKLHGEIEVNNPVCFDVAVIDVNVPAEIIAALVAAGVLVELATDSSSSGPYVSQYQLTARALAQQPIDVVNIDSGTTVINS